MATTEIRSERALKKRIYDTFYWDSRLNSANVNVEVDGEGKVTLTGSVPSQDQIKYAETDALTVPGVARVTNHLTVKFNDMVVVPNDYEVAAIIRNIIHWNSDIDTTGITVSVNAGSVVLKGTVISYFEKIRAEELANDVIGVLKVENRLAVVPVIYEIDTEIAGKVVKNLFDNLGPDAGAITVMVKHRVVTLTGSVPDDLAWQAAANAAHVVESVTDVHNELEIRK